MRKWSTVMKKWGIVEMLCYAKMVYFGNSVETCDGSVDHLVAKMKHCEETTQHCDRKLDHCKATMDLF